MTDQEPADPTGATRLQRVRPMLRTWDLDRTIAFWVDVLGFTCRTRNDEWGWAALERDEIEVMLSTPNEAAGDPEEPSPGFTGSIYFDCDDVDDCFADQQAAAAATDHELTVAYEPESFDYGMREFAVFDPNGYLLQFGQELPGADDGMGAGSASEEVRR